LILLNNQPISIINSKYNQFEYKTNVAIAADLNYFNKLAVNDMSFEIPRLFCKSSLVGSTKLYHNAIDESMKDRVNSNDSMMTVTVYYYSKGSL